MTNEMTVEEAIKQIKENCYFASISEKTKQALDKAIQALEQQPNRCDSCTHSEEQDGSNCYECVKGMADNFEAQPKIGYISIDVNKLAKEVAEKALDEITYEEKTIREWAEILVNQQPSEDYISRELAIEHIKDCCEDDGLYCVDDGEIIINIIKALPSVTPRTNLAETSQDCISREEMLKYQQYLHGKMSNEENHKLWNFIKGLPSVTPKYTDEEIDKAQAVEQAYVDKMVELAVEESRKKWLNSFDTSSATKCFEAVNILKERLEHEET